MLKSGIDQQALIDQFASASAQQTAQLQASVTEATLKALEGREMSLKNIRGVVKSVTEAASKGAASSMASRVDLPALLHTAIAGLDDALLRAVDANRLALARFVDQGVDLQDKRLKKALSDLEKFEETLIGSVQKAAGGAADKLTEPGAQVLGQYAQTGSASGAQATATVAQLTTQAQTALREARASGLKAAQVLTHSYAALVSGVLMGLADALRQGAAAAPAPVSKAAPRPAARARRKPAGPAA